MSDYKTMTFTPKRAKRLADAHNKAVKEGKDSFVFDGSEFVTMYAHYVLEYMVINKIIIGKFSDDKTFTYETE